MSNILLSSNMIHKYHERKARKFQPSTSHPTHSDVRTCAIVPNAGPTFDSAADNYEYPQ